MMREDDAPPNAKLRRAREERALSQEQVAELVADEVERRRGRRPAIDADQISRYERGLHRWPGRTTASPSGRSSTSRPTPTWASPRVARAVEAQGTRSHGLHCRAKRAPSRVVNLLASTPWTDASFC